MHINPIADLTSALKSLYTPMQYYFYLSYFTVHV